MIKDNLTNPKYRAIDLYSGIGGWNLGLKMSGIDTVNSYEWWPVAAQTHKQNLGGHVSIVDIRKLDLYQLPKNIDIVVGSPPCTEFSFSNRGGRGNISEGLKDLYKFLEIVKYLKPKFWVMENVPRVKNILEKELLENGQLSEFKELINVIEIVDCSDFGLPQRRKRMLAGNFPFKVLKSYIDQMPKYNLGQVISNLNNNQQTIKDLIYHHEIPKKSLTDNDFEKELDSEELRLNKESKQYHRVYNMMNFPEPLDKTSRTITAAETRVSRESLIVKNGTGFRRLSLREKATLQGFPISYQFYGSNYSDRQKMIGNAIPPLLTYYIGQSILNIPKNKIDQSIRSYDFQIPKDLPTKIKAKKITNRFKSDRRFRSALRHLRFGSGVRFELSNEFINGKVFWQINFYYGSSKKYTSLTPDNIIAEKISMKINDNTDILSKNKNILIQELNHGINSNEIQNVWNHSKTGLGPFEVIDLLGQIFIDVKKTISSIENNKLETIFDECLNKNFDNQLFLNKKRENIAVDILIGFLISGWFNNLYPIKR